MSQKFPINFTMDIFTYYAKYYDQILDSVALFNKAGEVIYCNDAFSVFTGYSVVRFQNKKATLPIAIKSYKEADFDINEFIKLADCDGTEIVNLETKAIFRGLAQITVKRVELSKEITEIETEEELFILSLKDLSLEEDLMQSFRSEIDNRNKKIQEMNQLIEILQKIRLLDDPYETINEFINYMLGLNKVCLSGSLRNGQFTRLEHANNTIQEHDENPKAVLSEINKFLEDNKTTKYVCYPSEIRSEAGDKFQWSVVPFKFGKNEIFAVFIFDTQKQKEEFAHQSAIILSVQLNLILNNLTLKEFAITDGLTRLKNSSFFREQLEILCSKHMTGQLILFDVDFFKKVNDVYGHLGGDAVLIMIGEKIPQVVKNFSPDDFANTIVARVGGEEFAIFIPDKDEEYGCKMAESLRAEIEKTPVSYNQISIQITISLGVASWVFQDGYNNKKVTSLYKSSDEALYRSKKSGRNQVSYIKAA